MINLDHERPLLSGSSLNIKRLRQLQQLERLSSLGMNASNFIHRFNNCLCVVFGNLQIMQSKLGQEEIETHVANLLNKSLQSIKNMQDENSNFLRYLHEDGEKDEKILDLKELIQRLHANIKNTLRNQVKISAPTEELSVLAREHDLQDVFFNLLINADQAVCDSGTINPIIIELSLSNDRQLIICRIIDKGVGMDQKTQQLIFEPFFSTKKNGLGFGLYFVRHVLDSIGCSLSVQSEPGQGSSFTLQFSSHIKQ